jgi:hypothetical protein
MFGHSGVEKESGRGERGRDGGYFDDRENEDDA